MKIEKYLFEKGIKPHLKGFDYLIQAIEICQKDKSVLRKITTELYPTIAKINNDTPSRSARAIRHAISTSKENVSNSEFIGRAVIELED